jgi:hypothetical protein
MSERTTVQDCAQGLIRNASDTGRLEGVRTSMTIEKEDAEMASPTRDSVPSGTTHIERRTSNEFGMEAQQLPGDDEIDGDIDEEGLKWVDPGFKRNEDVPLDQDSSVYADYFDNHGISYICSYLDIIS